MLDAVQALVCAASPPTYQAPRWPLVDLDSAAEVIGATALGADRPANPRALASAEPGADNDGGGGGGSLGAWGLLALALALAVFALRRAVLAEPARPA